MKSRAQKLICWMRKLYRVYYDFPMNWQPWGWEHADMSRLYWNGESVRACGMERK